MDNGLNYDLMDEPVTLLPSGREVKRRSDTYTRSVAKRIRHSGKHTEPNISCSHKSQSMRLASTLTEEELRTMHGIMYAVPDKVKQDALL